MANITKSPSTVAIGFTGEDAYFVNSGDMRVIFTGYAPTLIYSKTIVRPITGSMNLVTKKVFRATGIQFFGQDITVFLGDKVVTDTGSLLLSSFKPQVIEQSPTGKRVAPTTGLATLAVKSITTIATISVEPGVGGTTLTGKAISVTQTHPRYPFFDQLQITTSIPKITVSGVPQSGTSITNQAATTNVPVNYQIDDRTGFKVKIKQPLVEEYTGFMTRPDSLDKQSEQDFLRSKVENQRGAERPDDTGKERHIDVLYPDGVSTEDL